MNISKEYIKTLSGGDGITITTQDIKKLCGDDKMTATELIKRADATPEEIEIMLFEHKKYCEALTESITKTKSNLEK